MAKQYLMPYTNLHELNLDWLINAMKQLESQWDSYGTEITATVESLPSGSKAEVEVTGSLKDKMNMNFKLPVGDKGTTYYPEVTKEGVISWSNDGGKENPTSVNIKGPQGDQGPAGSGLNILDTYETLEELKAAHPTGQSGDAYLIGTAPNFVMYIWSTDTKEWTNAGTIATPSPSSTIPLQDSDNGSAGTETSYSRGDHVHPHDDSKVSIIKSANTSFYTQDGTTTYLTNASAFVYQDELTNKLKTKQDLLVSGTNIKTINSQSLLGDGDINLKLNLETLWTNANTSAEFDTQSYALDLMDYNFFILVSKIWTGGYQWVTTLLTKEKENIITWSSVRNRNRFVSITNSSITFGEGKTYDTYGSDTVTTNNTMLIPALLFGIKVGV